MSKLVVNIKDSCLPVHVQFIEQGPQGKEFLAYAIITYFAGSFLYNALLTASDFASNTKLHEHIINEFSNDFGWDFKDWKLYFEECWGESPLVTVIE